MFFIKTQKENLISHSLLVKSGNTAPTSIITAANVAATLAVLCPSIAASVAYRAAHAKWPPMIVCR